MVEISASIRDSLRENDGELITRPSNQNKPVNNRNYKNLPQRKRKHPSSGRFGEHADMMKQYHCTKITLDDIENGFKRKENPQQKMVSNVYIVIVGVHEAF